MKALRSAMLPAALASAFLTGCAFHGRGWEAPQEREAATEAESQPTVIQQGSPVEAKREGDRVERTEKFLREEARKADRAREELARAPETGESREMQLWRLNQQQIDQLLEGDASDGHMLGMFLMANDVDLSAAKLAYNRTESVDVRAFAKRMITDHTQMIVTLKTLIADRDIVPADNRLARNLRDLASIQRDSLAARDGQGFDRAYVAWEIENHKQLLSVIDDVLLPRADDGQLREMVATMRPVISAHLAHAEQLHSALVKR